MFIYELVFFLPKICLRFSPENYYAVIIVDSKGLRVAADVEVSFTIRVGKFVLVNVVSAEPFEDGIFYFEAVSKFKVLLQVLDF
jgi:hypothetical protein